MTLIGGLPPACGLLGRNELRVHLYWPCHYNCTVLRLPTAWCWLAHTAICGPKHCNVDCNCNDSCPCNDYRAHKDCLLAQCTGPQRITLSNLLALQRLCPQHLDMLNIPGLPLQLRIRPRYRHNTFEARLLWRLDTLPCCDNFWSHNVDYTKLLSIEPFHTGCITYMESYLAATTS